MSTTVDERVVEMRFDNKNFEQNIQTSMSTLDKLKKSLNLQGAAKGLESVNNAAYKCSSNMSPLSNAVETVKVRFSALEVMAITALTNITNSAINTGKHIVSAFTIDPIKSGFEEYETQINAVQTILANTSSKGTTLDQVNTALDELNHYADMTIYNFTQMTRNIGTFTAAGVDLDTSVAAIKGIANLAAVSGSNSQQASTAMYQLSQALAAGTVKLMDWNSVVNAGMGGQVFQDALKETARVHGIAIDDMITAEGSFRETLSKGWLTSEILTETLSKFTGDLNEEQLRTMGYTDEQIQSIIKMGQTANDAATKVKTFTQLFDTLKEAAQSGWTQSWEIIVGDFEKAKERLTKVSEIFSDIINKGADRRNAILQGAFGSKWDTLTSKLSAAGIETETFQNKVKQLASSHNVDLDAMIEKEGSFEKALKKAFNDGTLDKGILKDAIKSFVNDITGATESTEKMTGQVAEYGEIVNRVINGEFGTGEARIKALTEAGYDYATVQNLVNEKLGTSVRHLSSLTEEQLKNADSLAALSDEQLKNKDYTDEQIEAIRDLAKQADEAGSSIDDLISDFEKPSGAELLWDSVLNVIDSVVNSLAAVKKAWNDTFHHGMTEDEIIKERSEKLYNVIAAINKFTEKLKLTDDKAVKITRTFKGLFAIIDIITTITGGGLKLAFKGLSIILSAFDMDILDLTANIGDMLVKFHDFVLDNDRLTEGLKIAKSALETVVAFVKKWINSFVSLPIVQRNIARFNEAFQNTFSSVREYLGGGVERFKEFIERVKALDHITLDNIGDIFKDFKDNVIDYFLNITGQFDSLTDAIKKFKDDIKKYFTVVGGDVDGLKSKIFEFVKAIKEKFSENIGIGEILSIGIGAGIIVFVKKIGNALEMLSGPFGSIAGILRNFEGLLGSCSKAINAFALKTKSQALLNVAIAVGILAASLVALTLVDQSKLWSAAGALGALAGGLLAVSAAMGIIGKIGGNKGSVSMLGIAAALLILVKTLKSMETLNSDNLWKNIGILGTMAVGLATIAGILGRFAPQLSKGTLTLIGISVSLKILVSALKDIDSLQLDNMERSIEILIGAMGGLVILAAACKNIKMGSAVGILAMVVALKLFISVFDDIAEIDIGKMKSSMDTLIIIFGSFAALMVASKFAGSNAAKAGVGILAMSAALLLIAGTIKILATVDNGDLKKATDTIGKILLLFAAVVVASKFAGANAVKAGAMLALMSGALLILAGVIVILSHITPDGLDQALKAITTLEIMFAGLIAVSYLAKDCKSTLVVISTTIGLLAVVLGALSMINPENLKAATNVLSQVMFMFGILIASTALAKNANGTLIIMTGTVTVLAGILALLAKLPVDSVLGVSGALSILLLSLSASMAIIGIAGAAAPGAYLTLGVMTLVVAGLAAIIGVLAAMNVNGVLEIAEGLSVLLLSLSASCLILSAVGASGPASFIGIAALAALIVGITGVMAGIGVLATYYPELEDFVNKGISLLEAVGYGLGSFFGNIVGGFLTNSTAGLIEVGANLSAFMENASPFFSSVQNLGESTLSGIKSLAETILILTAADMLQGITSWLTGGSSLSTFGEELVPFGKAMSDFSVAVSGLNGDVVTNAATAGKALAEMASTIPNTGGVVGFFAGENDMEAFGRQLVPFGRAMKGFGEAVTGLKSDAITEAAIAGKAMTEMASTIPNTGGVVGFFAGENDMEAFGEQLEPFGKAMKNFGEAVDGLKSNAITEAAIAGKAMTEMASTIPNTGGLVSFFTGDNDMKAFGEQLEPFGKAIKEYGDAVYGLKTNAIADSATAGKALIELANTVPNTGGLVSWFTGDNDLATFGSHLVDFGKAMQDYSTAITDIDSEAISNSTIAGKALVELGNTLPNTGGLVSWFTGDNDLGTFGNSLIEFGKGIKGYSESLNGVDTGVMASVITQVNRLVDMAKGMTDLDTSGMSGFSTALGTLGETGITEFINAFENAETKVIQAGSNLINRFLEGINKVNPQLQDAGYKLMVDFINKLASAMDSNISLLKPSIERLVSEIISGISNGLRAGVDDCQDAGKFMMQGFGKGIESEFSYIVECAKNTVSGAVDAIKDFLGIHSPSKLMAELGEYSGEGYEEGLLSTESDIEDAGESVAEAAYSGMDEIGKKLTEEEKKSLLERSEHWNNLIKIVDEGVSQKNSLETQSVQDTQQINAQNAQLSKERIQQEEAYWVNLLAEKKKGAEAEKYQSMNIVEFRKSIVEQSIDILKNYTDTLKSTTESMMNDSDMFTDVVTSRDLINRLSEQISEIEEYKNVIASLNERIPDGGLKEAISEMGVDSLEELKLINGMTDAELTNYVQLYEQKYAACQEAASVKLSGLQTETEAQLSALYGGVQVKLDTFAQSFNGTFESIRNYVGESISIGSNIASGVADGIAQNTQGAKDAAEKLIKDTEDAAKVAADIQSPSGLFRDNVGTYITQGVAEGMIDENAKASLRTSVNTIIDEVVQAFDDSETKSKFNQIGTDVSDELRSYTNYEKFRSAGAYLVEGFANGISENTWKAEATARAMARAAAEAAEDELDEASPSKVGYRIGDFFGMGFVNAIDTYEDTAYDASANMAKSARIGLDNAIQKMNVSLGSIDDQPTIRPVLDLSDVETKSRRLNSLFSRTQALSISTGIQTEKDRKLQNEDSNKPLSNSYNFTQNNYSPKALSRTEIYRQTKNQFSAMERMATV